MAATARRQRCSALTGLATAAAICVVIQLLLSPNAAAAVGDRVRLTLPEPGQLAAARLEFNVKGEKKPKLRLKAKNTGALPPGTVVAAQMARSTQKRGRAVALVAIASPAGSGTPRGPERVTSDSVLIDVQAAGRGQQITSIALENAPSATRNFLSVIGAEPLQERELAQQVFDLPESEIPDDSLGRLDLARAAEPMDLDFTRPAEIVFPRKGLQQELDELQLIQSSIAGAVGPPAALDARIYELISGRPAPLLIDASSFASPANPNVIFTGVQFSTGVMGVQVSQASDNPVLQTPDARCQNGAFGDGVVTRGAGPRLTFGFGFRLDCDLPQDSPRVFFDVPLERPPDPGIDLLKLMPLPFYGSDSVGEAVAGEQVTFLIRG